MLKGCGRILPKGVLAIIAVAFFAIGGCDVEFGGGGGDNGGGGGGVRQTETIQGTVIDVIPEQDIEGITVDASVGATIRSDVTDPGGFFSITGPLAGTAMIEFTDDTGMFLGSRFVEIFPTARVELGDIILENGVVKLQNVNPEVTFDAEVTQNNCTGNSGSMQVEASNNQGTATVIVQIVPSTDLIINGEEVSCEDIRVGRGVEVQGDLVSSSTVDATRVEID